MGTFGPMHWIILGGIVLLLFGGRGKLSSVMGDAAKGIRAFRDGLKGEEHDAAGAATPLPRPEADKDPIVR
jgi:sec-independent protein translocase protein TatA